jgi:hypothetical protein
MGKPTAEPSWLPGLVAQVQQVFQELDKKSPDLRSALNHERQQIENQCAGWSQSLANPTLSSGVRTEIEAQYSDAVARRAEIDTDLQEQEFIGVRNQELIERAPILDRLQRLDQVLAENNPTLGNLELSQVIDRIVCRSDRKVVLRMCKLGLLPEAIDVLATEPNGEVPPSDSAPTKKPKTKPRRRTRLRTVGAENGTDARALADFVADPQRFSGLGDEWFWIKSFQVPEPKTPWYIANAEAVFCRRQESKLSFDKLAVEFHTTDTTIRAAMKHYLDAHPDERDSVDLPHGRGESRTVDVEPHMAEVRRLFDDGYSKLALAKKFNWPTSAVDRALKLSYAKEGKRVPTKEERRQQQIDRARQLYKDQLKKGKVSLADKGKVSLADIARALHVSDITARDYLRESFKAQGEIMPDLRGWRGQSA